MGRSSTRWEGLDRPDYPGAEPVGYLAVRLKEARSVVGLLFYQNCWVAGNSRFLDFDRAEENALYRQLGVPVLKIIL